MSIITRMRNAATGFLNSPLEKPRYSLDDPALWDILDGGRESEAGARVTHRTAIGYPPLRRGINLISGDVARGSKPPVAAAVHVSPHQRQRQGKRHRPYRLSTRPTQGLADPQGGDLFGVIFNDEHPGLTPTNLAKALEEIGPVRELRIRIDSPGGVISGAAYMMNQLKEHPAKITADVMGEAASAAGWLFQVADVSACTKMPC